MDWSDPTARGQLMKSAGSAAFNRQQAEEFKRQTVATVNGYNIRRVVSERWGVVFMVDGLDIGFKSLSKARVYARNTNKGSKDETDFDACNCPSCR